MCFLKFFVKYIIKNDQLILLVNLKFAKIARELELNKLVASLEDEINLKDVNIS